MEKILLRLWNYCACHAKAGVTFAPKRGSHSPLNPLHPPSFRGKCDPRWFRGKCDPRALSNHCCPCHSGVPHRCMDEWREGWMDGPGTIWIPSARDHVHFFLHLSERAWVPGSLHTSHFPEKLPFQELWLFGDWCGCVQDTGYPQHVFLKLRLWDSYELYLGRYILVVEHGGTWWNMVGSPVFGHVHCPQLTEHPPSLRNTNFGSASLFSQPRLMGASSRS